MFKSDEHCVGETEGWVEGFPSEATIKFPYLREVVQQKHLHDESDVIWYQKTIRISEQRKGKPALIHF